MFFVSCSNNVTGEITRHAKSEMVKAMTKYVNSSSSAPPPKSKGRFQRRCRLSRAQRAGLQFAPVKMRVFFPGRVNKVAEVVFAAGMEYVCAEILELSGNAARDSKKLRITPRHIFLAIAYDSELCDMFFVNNFLVLPNASVVPCICPQRIRRNNPSITQALREIRWDLRGFSFQWSIYFVLFIHSNYFNNTDVQLFNVFILVFTFGFKSTLYPPGSPNDTRGYFEGSRVPNRTEYWINLDKYLIQINILRVSNRKWNSNSLTSSPGGSRSPLNRCFLTKAPSLFSNMCGRTFLMGRPALGQGRLAWRWVIEE